MSLKKLISIRFLLLITCMSFTVSVVWIQFTDKECLTDYVLVHEAIENVGRDVRYAEVYRKTERLPKGLKFILLWEDVGFAPFYFFGHGQRQFIENNCLHINCYVTSNINLFKGDATKFHAILFNGRTMFNTTRLPRQRSPHQRYIYVNMESSDYFPSCAEFYDDFYNWTATYRLDSDIPFPYIQIRNSQGEVIGPKRDMKWMDLGVLNDQELEIRMRNKTKAVAWFVSHCSTKSRREDYAEQLKKALNPFGFTLDMYGSCGPLKCSKLSKGTCFSLLENKYFFYLSFENSFSEDYVTEKLLTALRHNVVPIVLGGADYSRFLPPGSYINAGMMTPKELASMIVRLMMNTKYYIQFFRWRAHYSYRDPTTTDDVCAVCDALNNKNKTKKWTSYKTFRKWWHPDYKKRCS